MDILLKDNNLIDSCARAVVLSEATSETFYKVVEVPDIALLDSLGIQRGGFVTKHFQYAFGGPIILGIDKCQIAIGRKIASLIKVVEANCDTEE